MCCQECCLLTRLTSESPSRHQKRDAYYPSHAEQAVNTQGLDEVLVGPFPAQYSALPSPAVKAWSLTFVSKSSAWLSFCVWIHLSILLLRKILTELNAKFPYPNFKAIPHCSGDETLLGPSVILVCLDTCNTLGSVVLMQAGLHFWLYRSIAH